ncbi:MBL fold metallo-hydrolase [Parasphingopyxis algicola]|uniref:MBL fold metallo-hydrolase n=1 Tax=Parasphingopyxis algicola TaxID=2026624 RepID=UPI0015A1FE73|nr:MBL fold metallo-hydrolase [Parasphingopyxis algicola]QLC26472.1 MBL fold metallo-hydrolase [Parasphingopyxis algicola]
MEPLFRIGRHRVWRIEEWGGKFAPPQDLFAEHDEQTFAGEAAAFTPDYLRDGELYAFLQSWLIDADGVRILVDTGAGNGKDRPHIPVFGQLDTDFLARFGETGVKPDEIDIVVCTHLHIDHVGWNTRWDGEDWIPTFPNARYLFPAIDREVWDPAGSHYAAMLGRDVNANVFEDSVKSVLDDGLVELVKNGFEVGPGITMRDAPGHTPGHMVLDVRSESDSALFTRDVLHHPMQVIRPNSNSIYCENRAVAAGTRRRIVAEAASQGARIVPAHFGGTHSVFVRQTDQGFRPVKG